MDKFFLHSKNHSFSLIFILALIAIADVIQRPSMFTGITFIVFFLLYIAEMLWQSKREKTITFNQMQSEYEGNADYDSNGEVIIRTGYYREFGVENWDNIPLKREE